MLRKTDGMLSWTPTVRNSNMETRKLILGFMCFSPYVARTVQLALAVLNKRRTSGVFTLYVPL